MKLFDSSVRNYVGEPRFVNNDQSEIEFEIEVDFNAGQFVSNTSASTSSFAEYCPPGYRKGLEGKNWCYDVYDEMCGEWQTRPLNSSCVKE